MASRTSVAVAVRIDVQSLERGRGKAVLLLEQGEQKVRGSDLGVPRGARDALRGGDRLLRVVRQPIRSHAWRDSSKKSKS